MDVSREVVARASFGEQLGDRRSLKFCRLQLFSSQKVDPIFFWKNADNRGGGHFNTVACGKVEFAKKTGGNEPFGGIVISKFEMI